MLKRYTCSVCSECTSMTSLTSLTIFSAAVGKRTVIVTAIMMGRSEEALSRDPA